jgi:ribonuclease Y
LEINPYIAFIASLVVGLPLGWLSYRIFRAGILHSAESEAEEIIREAKDRMEIQLLEEKERTQEIEGELWSKDEPAMLKTEERIEELQELADEKKQKSDNHYSQERQRTVQFEAEIQKGESHVQKLEKDLQSVRGTIQQLNQQYVDKLSTRLETQKSTVQNDIVDEILRDAEERARKYIDKSEEDNKDQAEDRAKYYLDVALARFARPYCGERGISSVYFELPEQRAVLCDPEGKNLATIQEITGCDIVVEPDSELVGVAGFDPVRRELTRRLIERILKEKKTVNTQFIKEKAEHIKRELFALIKRDGDAIAKELGLQGLHPEIRQMMGSLRYRYSFTQNQYFHCAEVGWLCGVLAQEMGNVDPRKAKRSGMLHDLGKSMDHAMDGGHAMIGANFIEARNEAADVIHAVRAHHFDETPSTDMAFLVIAADAISGARPGARRSTMENYQQKVTELDSIARSFDGVTDCYVLSGGRELRVMVNGKRIDDLGAMKMGREIATRLENECNYPGQIKVVVVRETLVVETTRAQG